ncbi:hypothetical protein A0O28_0090830 [Trichoderma guizhouense]|uniref:Methyltransferase domain-containing protein n=1 Tax=Trichoderma guizhouense TaxID=1491466 RepID=A0A1T3CVB6_9HYPO|nr:hypothetical protein A0O28_0090830 [Trichoderma guizhouense]
MSDYSAVFLYSSTLGALPLDSNFARAARRENSTPGAPIRRRTLCTLSSSSALGPAASASVGPDSASLRLSPATSANTKKSTSTSATGSAASASAPASTSSNPFSPPPLPHTQSHPPPPTPTQSSSTGSRASRTFSRLHRARLSGSASTVVDAAGRNANVQSPPEQDNNKQMTGFPTSRAESVSSASGHTPASSRTILSTDPSATDGLPASRPFVQRNGRTFLNDHTLVYPLPSDLTELHRQVLRTMLLIQVIGAPVLSPDLIKKPPQRVLEIGCGSGFWSNMCHHYFKSRGHGGLSFTGIDIAPLAPDNSSSTSDDAMKPSSDMQWKFVQHDLRQMPWPIPSEEYDLVMVKDVSYALTNKMMQPFIEECVRMVRPGGTLRPHVPTSTVSAEDAEEQAAAASLGAYVINPQTPLSVPSNNYIAEYNSWLTKALEKLDINPLPCTVIGPTLLQEYETLGDVRSRRIALPLSEFRWEKEGIGGVITTDSKPEGKGKEASAPKSDKKTLTAGQIALRQTALLTQVQEMQALEPILRDVSGKSQDELDMWLTKMMNDLMDESGTSLGECLEFGAWYAKKKKVAA